MTELAFGALVVAAVAWTVGNTGMARGATSLARFVFVVFLAIAAILFAIAVLGGNVSTQEHLSPPHAAGRLPWQTPGAGRGRNTFRREWGLDVAFAITSLLSIDRKPATFKGEAVHGKPENVPSASILVRERLSNLRRPGARASSRPQRGARVSGLQQSGAVSKGVARNPVAERTAISHPSIA